MMQTTVWLKIGARKKYGRWEVSTVHSFKRDKPTVKANEIAVKLNLEIPENLFDEPTFELKATLPAAPTKVVSAAEITKEVSKALSEKMGMKVKVSMVEAGSEKDKKAGFTEELRTV